MAKGYDPCQNIDDILPDVLNVKFPGMLSSLRSPLPLLPALCVFLSLVSASGDDLKKPYFTGTTPGAWSEYLLASPDGSKSSFSYERGADDAGRAVIDMQCKILAGPGKDSVSKLTYTLPEKFDLNRDGLSYGKYTEKMVMHVNGADMPVDEATLEVIRKGSKDFGGAVKFEAAEKVGNRTCDRYSYLVKTGGPAPTVETGRLWLDPSVPFAIVRQVAKVVDEKGATVTEFDMNLQETGLNQLIAESAATPAPAEPKATPAPSAVGLAEGFKGGRVGMDIEVVPGSSGRSLLLTLVNKTGTELKVSVPAGEVSFEADSPVHTLLLTIPKATTVVLPADESSRPLTVGQRGVRGVIEGHCSLSVYEGTPLCSGSVTIGNLPK